MDYRYNVRDPVLLENALRLCCQLERSAASLELLAPPLLLRTLHLLTLPHLPDLFSNQMHLHNIAGTQFSI